ncbi:unnamed protein product [Adineta ricciae]|uniref:Uncharacterized protein n=1 Tax=Adineta ricciae TaxID=249248 RepID=A0A815HSB8_ADIRI|nr:unnamed protein product [Adineta ricciae]
MSLGTIYGKLETCKALPMPYMKQLCTNVHSVKTFVDLLRLFVNVEQLDLSIKLSVEFTDLSTSKQGTILF